MIAIVLHLQKKEGEFYRVAKGLFNSRYKFTLITFVDKVGKLAQDG